MQFTKHKPVIFPFEWLEEPHLWVVVPPSVNSVAGFEQDNRRETIEKRDMVSLRLSYEMVAIDVPVDVLQPLFEKEDAKGVAQLVTQSLRDGRTRQLTPQEISTKMPYADCIRAMNLVVGMINGPRLTQTAAEAAEAEKQVGDDKGEQLSD